MLRCSFCLLLLISLAAGCVSQPQVQQVVNESMPELDYDLVKARNDKSHQLLQRTFSAEYENRPLEEVIQDVSDQTGLNIYVAWSILASDMNITGETPISLKMNEATMEAIFNEVLSQAQRASQNKAGRIIWQLVEGIVIISTNDDLLDDGNQLPLDLSAVRARWKNRKFVSAEERTSLRLEKLITVNFEDNRLSTVLTYLEKNHGLSFHELYEPADPGKVSMSAPVSLRMKSIPIRLALDLIVRQQSDFPEIDSQAWANFQGRILIGDKSEVDRYLNVFKNDSRLAIRKRVDAKLLPSERAALELEKVISVDQWFAHPREMINYLEQLINIDVVITWEYDQALIESLEPYQLRSKNMTAEEYLNSTIFMVVRSVDIPLSWRIIGGKVVIDTDEKLDKLEMQVNQ